MEYSKLLKSMYVIGILLFLIAFQVRANTCLPIDYQIDVFGKHYQVSKTIGIDAGWMHLSTKNQPIVIASLDSSASTVGARLTWNIV